MANNKMDRFLDTVYGTAEAKAAKMIREIDRAGENALREYRAEKRRSADAERRRESAKAARLGAESAAHDETEIRRELQALRTSIADKVFTEVARRIDEYKKTPAYRERLLRDAAKAAELLSGAEDAMILLCPADASFADEIAAASGLSAGTDATIALGGLRGVSESVEVDFTLDAQMALAREDFARESGLSVG